MKILIQHNWTTGLGDLYTAACEYLNFIKKLKEIGYETELVFSLHSGTMGNKYIDECDFEDIFDKKSFKYFDKISTRVWAHSEKTFNDLPYRFTTHGCDNPGVHWWDCFADTLPENIYAGYYGGDRYLTTNDKPEIFPKFNKIVYQKRKFFLENNPKKFNFIQFRMHDLGNHPNNMKEWTRKIKKQVKKSNNFFLVGSNNDYFINSLNKLPNVFKYKYTNLKKFTNDHPYYFYYKNGTKEEYLDRIHDNLAEMTSIEFAEKIYLASNFGWVSNFLFYGFTKNKNLKFEWINNRFEIIE
jgi:hypothetical protein